MRRGAEIPFIICVLCVLALAQPQERLVILVTGDAPEDLTLNVRLASGNRTWDAVCFLAGSLCELDVESVPVTVKYVITPQGLAVVRASGLTRSILSADLSSWFADGMIGLVPTRGGINASLNVQPRRENGALMLELEIRRAQVITIDISDATEGVYLGPPVSRWRALDLLVLNGTLYIVAPRNFTIKMTAAIDERSKLGMVIERISSPSPASRPGVPRRFVVDFSVSYGDPNASLAYFVARWLREELERYIARERAFLSRVGFDAEEYLSDVEFAAIALRVSEEAFRAGQRDVGRAFLEKGLAKALSSLITLSQVKADSITSFLLLLTFTLFLSLIVGNMLERRKRWGAVCVFTLLLLAGLALVPYARLALLHLDPVVLQRTSPSSVAFAILVAVSSLVIIGIFVLGVRGTALSDFFWYSVRGMRRRLRALLTIATIAVVTAAATAFLALGSLTMSREDVYPTSFRGISVSRHVTTVTYIVAGETSLMTVSESFEPLASGEVAWLKSAEWVERVYVVKAGLLTVSHGGRRALVSLIASDAIPLRGAAVSQRLAERLGINVGSAILVEGRPIVVSYIFSEDQPPVVLDGSPLLELPRAQGIVIVPLEEAPRELQVYKLLLEGKPPAGLKDRLIRMGYVWNSSVVATEVAQIFTNVYESYRVCEADGTRAACLMIVGEFTHASAAPEFVIVLFLSAAVVAITLLGTIHEKGKEYSTVSALGASPAYVAALVLVEGLSLGILGGVAGYVLGQFFQGLIPVRVVAVKPAPISPLLTGFLVALLPPVLGSVLPAREAALKVVPSRLMLRKSADVKIYQDMAETYVPLRVMGDAEEFVRYVKTFTERAPSVAWGPTYVRVDVKRRDGKVEEIEALVSFRSQRAALYTVKIILPRSSHETIRVVAYSATEKWTVDHKACAKEFLTSLHNDLLRYIEWKKMRKN